MTKKKRFLTAIKGGKPDCVPCAPWIAIQFPAKMLNIPLGDLCGALAVYPIWKATLETAKKFDVISDILSPLCIGGGEYIPIRDEPDYEDTKVKKTIFREDGKNRWVRITVTTPAGECAEERICPTDGIDASIKPIIRNPVSDYPKIKYLLQDPEHFDWSEHVKVQEAVGDSGVVRLGFDTPWTRWILLRGTDGYTDFYDFPDILDRFYNDYLTYIMKYIEVSEKYKPDFYWVHGVFDGMIGLNISNRYIYPFIKEVRKKTDVPLVRFISGKISDLLEIEAEAGIDALEVLEPIPTGNVDLADAKRRIGNQICLKGNLDPIHVLERGSIKDIEKQVRWCIDAASKNGAYIFSTADEVTPITPEENVYAMIECVKNYGKY